MFANICTRNRVTVRFRKIGFHLVVKLFNRGPIAERHRCRRTRERCYKTAITILAADSAISNMAIRYNQRNTEHVVVRRIDAGTQARIKIILGPGPNNFKGP